MQTSLGAMDHDAVLRSLQLLGSEVASLVRAGLAASTGKPARRPALLHQAESRTGSALSWLANGDSTCRGVPASSIAG